MSDRAAAAKQSPASNPVDELVRALTESDPGLDRRDAARLLKAAHELLSIGADRLDLKIAASALEEMTDAARVFLAVRQRRKVTIFGSARTQPSDPLYAHTREVASALAAQDWMVLTGAGPGIMAAGLEGAGRDNALGVNIRLPFESTANEHVDPSMLVEMKYFFTRKLSLVRESSAFVVMPGGFGTLDEAFELLTLLQTGKMAPVPVVMLGLGRGYWRAWRRFVDEVIDQHYVSAEDRHLFLVTNDVTEAVEEITDFYRNYHSLRWVGPNLIIRMLRAPSKEQLAILNEDFADLCRASPITRTGPLPPEVDDGDQVSLARIRFRHEGRHNGRLRQLIDAVNRW